MYTKSLFAQRHSFHLVDFSAMPILTALATMTLMIGNVMFFHGFKLGFETTFIGVISVLLCMYLW
jgi:hypothetical protein